MMKTILALTDFSESAENASRYAFELAKRVKANLILCNAITVPLTEPIPGGMVWPMDYDSVITQSKRALKDYANLIVDTSGLPDNAFPKVSVKAEVGDLSDLVRGAVLTARVNLAVMGLSGAGDMRRFFLGSSTRDMIDTGQLPLMLIPKSVKFSTLTKIAFATDLSTADFEAIQSLAGLAAAFNAELLIVHVVENGAGPERTGKINDFIAQLKTEINYDKIYYKNVYNKDVEGGLEWLSEHGQVDCLAMIHRPHDFLDRVLKGSHSQKMARLTELPLLVFPQGYKAVVC
ncbi:universal stress protein [Pedobacter paludis]|uniref:UspA domain-containing protein n=1 Tax=Pedobacter paludis TaxID=2203212 RepID=A0A317EZ12_9SPHI|nr:universal stress protein [Pedobacter paludis]PWS30436.1 hypothetical protein DF947_18620 [Pedobacter paludis]